MASWTITGSTTSSTYWKARMVITEQSQNINNNTTSLKVSFQLGRAVVSSYLYSYNTNWYINIGSDKSGTKTLSTWNWDPASAGSWKEIATRTVTVTHDDDGTKSVSISCKWWNTGVSPSEATVSGTVKLTTIPRATTPTLSGSSYIGSVMTISTASRASSKFTHMLYYSWGSSLTNQLIALTTTGYPWTIPTKLAEYIQTSTSGVVSIRCDTYNGSTKIGSKTIKKTLYVPTSAGYQPSIESVTVAETATVPVDAYVVGHSMLKITVKAYGAGSTTSRNSYVASANVIVDGTTYKKTFNSSSSNTWSITTSILKGSGTKNVAVTVYDSRGRSVSNNSTQYVAYDYATPEISSFKAERCDNTGTVKDDGEYIKCTMISSVTSIASKNAKKYKLCYLSGDTEITMKQGDLDNYSATTEYISTEGSYTFSINNTYTVRAYIWDSFTSATPSMVEVKVPTEATFFDWRANGKGFAFGKVSTKDGVESAWPIYDMNDFQVGIESMEIGSGYGHIKYLNGTLMQWGTVAITPDTANTVKSAQIMFDRPYELTPHIWAALQSNVPNAITWGIGAGSQVGDSLTSMMIYMTRINTIATTFRWAAIGKAASE